MKKSIALAACISMLLTSSAVLAEPKQLILNYDGFFDRLDDLDEPEFSQVTLGFYFKQKGNGQACDIQSVTLKSQSDSRDVYFYATGEVLLPFDEQLDMDKAKLIIAHTSDQECGLDMRLETKSLLSDTITTSDTLALVNTFELALDELAGMMAFMLPEVSGVTFIGKEAQPLVVQNSSAGNCELNRCTFEKFELTGASDKLEFNSTPVKAVPFIKTDQGTR